MGYLDYPGLQRYHGKVQEEIDELKDDLSHIKPGLSDDAKDALLACFRNVAWTGTDGQTYYDALYDALYEETSQPDWVYNPGSDGRLDEQSYVTEFTVTDDCSVTYANQLMTWHVQKTENSHPMQYIRAKFGQMVGTYGRMKIIANFESQRFDPSTFVDAGFRIEVGTAQSTGKAYISLMQDGKYQIKYGQGDQEYVVRIVELEDIPYHNIDLIVDGNDQTLKIDNEVMYSVTGLSTSYIDGIRIYPATTTVNRDLIVAIKKIEYYSEK